MKSQRAALRYAKSLFDLAVERDQLDEVYEDMQLIGTVIRENRELSALLNSPVVKSDTKVNILKAISAGRVGELSLKFITLITEKGREAMMAGIADKFVSMVKDSKGIVIVEVTTAIPMDESTRAKVISTVNMMGEGTIELIEKVDPAVIGGFVIKADDKMIDDSVADKIKKLKREFSENPYISEM